MDFRGWHEGCSSHCSVSVADTWHSSASLRPLVGDNNPAQGPSSLACTPPSHYFPLQSDVAGGVGVDINGNFVFASGTRVVLQPDETKHPPSGQKHARRDPTSCYFLPSLPDTRHLTCLALGGIGNSLAAVAETASAPYMGVVGDDPPPTRLGPVNSPVV